MKLSKMQVNVTQLAELVNDGLSIDDVEQRMSFYISERKRLAFGDGYR